MDNIYDFVNLKFFKFKAFVQTLLLLFKTFNKNLCNSV